ncbi:hypothetical protein HDU88_009020 [Geranomyces variabilis]|nr:hypothetical protein HDU88_009020 [Geranomyces variabilis]
MRPDSLDLRVTFPAPVEDDIDMAFKGCLLTVSFAKQVQRKRMRITLKSPPKWGDVPHTLARSALSKALDGRRVEGKRQTGDG